MKSDADAYTYRVTWSEEDGEFVATCVEFGPSLSWLEPSAEEALAGMRRLVAETLADLAETGEPVPEPLGKKTFSGRFVVRLPPDLHRRLATEAAEAGISLNRLIAHRLSSPPPWRSAARKHRSSRAPRKGLAKE